MAISSEDNSLSLYGDDRENPISFTGEMTSRSIVKFVLTHFDSFIDARSKEARELKAFQEFQEKEKERANKEWSEELELRKKSDTLILGHDNWDSAFLKSREAFIINFY